MNSQVYQCNIDVVLAKSENDPFLESVGAIRLTELDSNFAKVGSGLLSRQFEREVFKLVDKFFDKIGMSRQQVLFACPKLITRSPLILTQKIPEKPFYGVPLNLLFSPYADPKIETSSTGTVITHRIVLYVFRARINNLGKLKKNHLITLFNGYPNLFEVNEHDVLFLNFPPPSFHDQFTRLSDLNDKLSIRIKIDDCFKNVSKFFSIFDPFEDLFKFSVSDTLKQTGRFKIISCLSLPFPFLKMEDKNIITTEFWDAYDSYKDPLRQIAYWPQLQSNFNPNAPIYDPTPRRNDTFQEELDKMIKYMSSRYFRK